MKIQAYFYEHVANGFALELVPETEVEHKLLQAAYKHGKLDSVASNNKFGNGTIIRIFCPEVENES